MIVTFLRKTLTFSFNPVLWLVKTRVMCAFVEKRDDSFVDEFSDRRIGVVILPWLSTDVPWFSVVFGLLLARHGDHVVFILDDLPFGDKPFRFNFILKCLKHLLKKLSAHHEILVLSEAQSVEDIQKKNRTDLEGYVNLNTIWALRGELESSGRGKYSELIRKQLTVSSCAIEALFSAHRFESILIPGGIYGSSGIWNACARAKGVRVASYDSGHEVLLLAADGVASQLQDIPRAVTMLKLRPVFVREQSTIMAEAHAELKRRMAGTDKFSSQLAPSIQQKCSSTQSVLLALNSPWDSAALGLHVVFKDTKQWIVETTAWVLENTTAEVVIRQHPAERFKIARSNDDYRSYLHDVFGENNRIRFVAAEDPVNTYDLLAEIKSVIVYTSTIGVEAALLGCNVITASKCYYSSLGFVFTAKTKNEYFRYIVDSLGGEIQTTAEMSQDAAICYYLTQCNNFIFTEFNPHKFDFWSKKTIDSLYVTDEINMCVESVSENIPIPILSHIRKMHSVEQR